MFAPGVFFFGVLLPVAVVALVAYGVWELSRSREPQPVTALTGGVAASAGARTILDERFARGDIDAEEYVQRRALLDGTVPSPPTDVVAVAAPTAGAPTADVTPMPDTTPAEAPTSEVALDPAASESEAG